MPPTAASPWRSSNRSANARPGPTPAFSGLSACNGCSACSHWSLRWAKVRMLEDETEYEDSVVRSRPAMFD